MRRLILISLVLMGCAKHESPTVETPAATPAPDYWLKGDMNQLVSNGLYYFIRRPKNPPAGLQKWVWFAPSRLGAGGSPSIPAEQYYFDKLNEAGITVVGIDVGESYGSPLGREQFETFYQYLQTQGFEAQGCMMLQSRGGLMGYSWMLDHPGRVKCVGGIFPLTTLTDYITVAGAASAWGVDPNWLQANLATQSPLEHNDPFAGVNIYHMHGDADATVHLQYDQQFVSQLASGQLQIIHGLGHEWQGPEFFQNDAFINFIIGNL